MRMLLPIILCILAGAAHGQSDAACSVLPNDAATDCAPTPAVCLERGPDSNTELRQLMFPLKNHYQCYTTCISSNETGSPVCAASVSSPRPQSTLVVSGPFHLRQYSVHRVFSPDSAQSQLYPNSHLCKYRVACNEPNTYMSVTLQDLDVEANSEQCGSEHTCLDSVTLQYPTGSQCTVCGSELVCRETGRPLDPLLLLNGLHGLMLNFNSNRKNGGCGFRLLAMCVRKTFFESNSCTLPEPTIPVTTPPPFPPGFGKRDAHNNREIIDSRARRYYSSIAVPQTARVVYEEREVAVWVGEVLRQRFPGVYVLQVYNDIEGPQIYLDSANGRSFPGYGVLRIGLGIVHYIQESAPSQVRASIRLDCMLIFPAFNFAQLKPTSAEQRLIQLLHHGIVATLTQSDDMAPQCTSHMTEEQRTEAERVALEYGRACNGFLRAAACAYQQLHMPRVTIDCLVDVPFPAT